MFRGRAKSPPETATRLDLWVRLANQLISTVYLSSGRWFPDCLYSLMDIHSWYGLQALQSRYCNDLCSVNLSSTHSRRI